MHSIRTKSTIVNSIAMALSIGIVTALSGVYIANLGHNSSEQTMRLLCETGKNNIDYYLHNIEDGKIDSNIEFDTLIIAYPIHGFNAPEIELLAISS